MLHYTLPSDTSLSDLPKNWNSVKSTVQELIRNEKLSPVVSDMSEANDDEDCCTICLAINPHYPLNVISTCCVGKMHFCTLCLLRNPEFLFASLQMKCPSCKKPFDVCYTPNHHHHHQQKDTQPLNDEYHYPQIHDMCDTTYNFVLSRPILLQQHGNSIFYHNFNQREYQSISRFRYHLNSNRMMDQYTGFPIKSNSFQKCARDVDEKKVIDDDSCVSLSCDYNLTTIKDEEPLSKESETFYNPITSTLKSFISFLSPQK
ncbi:hypothetical protein QTN25_002642 [Entamoeba marina]